MTDSVTDPPGPGGGNQRRVAWGGGSRTVRLDDPAVVRREYQDAERFGHRRAVYRNLLDGDRADDVLVGLLAGTRPRCVLEVGCGDGELAERIARVTGQPIVALDLSPRMVGLARARSVDALLGDVVDLPFPSAAFDVTVAHRMLYHVSDLDLGLAELARVLRPGGGLYATTFSERNLHELWELIGDDADYHVSFTSENGTERLLRHFASVDRHDARGTIEFRDRDSLVDYVASTIRRAHLADRIPPLSFPVRAESLFTVFVAHLSG